MSLPSLHRVINTLLNDLFLLSRTQLTELKLLFGVLNQGLPGLHCLLNESRRALELLAEMNRQRISTIRQLHAATGLPERVLVRTYRRAPIDGFDADLAAYAPQTIERLADLRAKGILSDDEFAAAKREVLAD